MTIYQKAQQTFIVTQGIQKIKRYARNLDIFNFDGNGSFKCRKVLFRGKPAWVLDFDFADGADRFLRKFSQAATLEAARKRETFLCDGLAAANS